MRAAGIKPCDRSCCVFDEKRFLVGGVRGWEKSDEIVVSSCEQTAGKRREEAIGRAKRGGSARAALW